MIYTIGGCRYYDEGDVMIVKSKLTNKFFLLCDACMSQWKNIEDFNSGNDIDSSEEEVEVYFNFTEEEVEESGWRSLVVNIMTY